MFLFLAIIALIFAIVFIWKNKLVIRIDTFFRKGFKRIKDQYGVYTWVGKQRRWKNTQLY